MITTMDLESGKHNRFLKVLTRITRPINGIEDIGEVTVELYHAGIFK